MSDRGSIFRNNYYEICSPSLFKTNRRIYFCSLPSPLLLRRENAFEVAHKLIGHSWLIPIANVTIGSDEEQAVV